MNASILLPKLLAAAWLAPLVAFAALAIARPSSARSKRTAGFFATGAIVLSAILAQAALWLVWLPAHGLATNPATAVSLPAPVAHAGRWLALGKFGQIEFSIGYYIDALTVVMFVVVTFVAACVYVYSFGYMRNELADTLADPEALGGGHSLHRPGRFHRFYQDLSLFAFSMLGLVLAGNLLMVFAFWELVGISSYLLIGFYFERARAASAAMKAFVVNRIGDAGLLVGLMILCGSLGTLDFGDVPKFGDSDWDPPQRGLFSLVRPEANEHRLTVPDGMLASAGAQELARIMREHRDPMVNDALGGADFAPGPGDGETPAAGGLGLAAARSEIASRLEQWRDEKGSPHRAGYWLLVVAGLGIFCGCAGKSAQAPLHVWLPDAMEGPTPVSALVHSATMVAAGVYLVGRAYPLLAAEALLVVAVVGCFTFCLAATVAVTATDIKRVLAWSTISQLGLMMLALGTGGWLPALFHLVTHAAFKSLLFLGAGSVIHAMHTNEMPLMGGLRRKMPWTAHTMFIGCLAISGFGIPGVIGLSGYYSKDAILAQTLAFRAANPSLSIFYFAALAGSALTSFYMFRLWLMTFAGECRDRRKFAAAHESGRSMVLPLVALAILAVGLGWSVGGLGVESLLGAAGRPASICRLLASS